MESRCREKQKRDISDACADVGFAPSLELLAPSFSAFVLLHDDLPSDAAVVLVRLAHVVAIDVKGLPAIAPHIIKSIAIRARQSFEVQFMNIGQRRTLA